MENGYTRGTLINTIKKGHRWVSYKDDWVGRGKMSHWSGTVSHGADFHAVPTWSQIQRQQVQGYRLAFCLERTVQLYGDTLRILTLAVK